MSNGVLDGLRRPNGWAWHSLWSTFARIQQAGKPDLPPLSVYLGHGVVLRDSRNDNHNQLGEDLSRYLVVRKGDLVFNKLRTWQGGLGRSEYEGIVSPAYFVCRPIESVDSRFVHYQMISDPYLAELKRISKWMPPSQFDTPWEALRRLPLLLPPLEEQRRIADFLDAETARIDKLSRTREIQIAELSERVGVELAAIPHEYSSACVTKVKYILRKRPRYGVLVPVFVDEGGVPFIRVNNLGSLDLVREDLIQIPRELSLQYRGTVTRPGDVLLSVVGTMGRALVVSPELADCNVARAVSVLRVSDGFDPYLLASWFETPSFLSQAHEAVGSDTAQPTLGMEDLSNFRLVWPFDLSEQRAASQRAASVKSAHANLSAKLRDQQAVAAERRQALITAAVTGQFDVSAASGRVV